MRPNPSNRDISRLPSRRAILIGGLLAITLAVLIVLKLRRADEHKGADNQDVNSQGSYRNRALLPDTPARRGSPVAAEKPAISGNVYSIKGELLPGATVVATTFELAGNIMSPVGSTTSDAHGRFKLTLPEGTYQLNASMVGYGPASVTANSGDTVSLMLPESGVIDGHVRDESGAPVTDFAIDVIIAIPGDAPASPPVWSKRFRSPDGSFRVDQLPIWDVVIRATAKGYAPGFTEQLSLSPKAHASVDMTLTRGCALSGTVKDKSGLALPRVFVDAESQLVEGEMTNLAMHAAAQAESDEDGSFHLSNVPKGKVVVRGYDGSNAVTTATIDVGECDSLSPMELVMSPGGSLTGVARRGDGTPIAFGKLTVMSRGLGFVNALTDREGRYTIEDLPAGQARMQLSHEGLSTLVFANVTEGTVSTKDITLFAAGKGELRGRVTASGKPVAGARLMIASLDQRSYDIGVYNPVTDGDGNYRVSALPEGAYLITVISVAKGKPAQIKGEEAVTVDLDVTPAPPRPAPRPPSERTAEPVN